MLKLICEHLPWQRCYILLCCSVTIRCIQINTGSRYCWMLWICSSVRATLGGPAKSCKWIHGLPLNDVHCCAFVPLCRLVSVPSFAQWSVDHSSIPRVDKNIPLQTNLLCPLTHKKTTTGHLIFGTFQPPFSFAWGPHQLDLLPGHMLPKVIKNVIPLCLADCTVVMFSWLDTCCWWTSWPHSLWLPHYVLLLFFSVWLPNHSSFLDDDFLPGVFSSQSFPWSVFTASELELYASESSSLSLWKTSKYTHKPHLNEWVTTL